MAIITEALIRVFLYNNFELQDPGAGLSLEEVRDVFSVQFPEVVSATFEGPERKGSKAVYTIRKAVGAKG